LGGIKDVDPHDEVGLQTVRWHKLCINAAMNPSAVLSGGRGNADMVADDELQRHLLGVMNEIRDAVPKILGRPFPESMAKPEKIIESTARNKGARPSMLLDWEAGKPLELEVILGNPVRIARERGVDMPRLQSLYALLRSAQGMRKREIKGKL
jgi:ketopantoate reductase